MKKTVGERKKQMGYLAVLLCVSAVLCYFVAQKEGYHMDELLSFELSNAEYNPWIVPTQPVGRLAKFMQEEICGDSIGETVSNLAATVQDVLRNRGNSRLLQYKADVYGEPVWISAGQFRDYLTVDGGDHFNYFSVYFNVKDDNHPPLHFMLLHTMSSLFPGRIAPFVGCVINILAVLGCMLCFFRLGMLLEGGAVVPAGYGRPLGICAGLLYGLSAGAIATTLLIRMYGLMTFFCVVLFYLHVRKWLEKGFGEKKKRLAAVTVLGFLTQYFFLFYCLTLAAVTAGLLIAKKRYGELKAYIVTMAVAGVVGVAVFPFSVQDVFSSGRGEEALHNLGQGFAGYGTRLAAFGDILLKGSFGGAAFGLSGTIVIICLCVAAALRATLKRGSRGKARVNGGESVNGKESVNSREKVNGEGVSSEKESSPLWMMLLIPFCCYFLLAARMSPYLVDRYVMPLFPFAAMILAILFVRLFSALLPTGRYWALLPVLALGIVNVAAYDGSYLYRGYGRQLEIAEQYREIPCVCLYEGYGFYYNLMEFTQYERTLLLKLPELQQREDTSGWAELEQLVVLKKSELAEEEVADALGLYGWEIGEVLLEPGESVYGDAVYLCVRRGGE